MELVWYRMLAPLLGGSTYTFGLILAIALLGIGGGGLLYAAGSSRRQPTLLAFAFTCTLEALCIVLPYAAGDRIALLTLMVQPLDTTGFARTVLGWASVTAVVVLPAAIVAGYQFPLLVALLGTGERRAGRDVGAAYACNTVGAIAGSLAGGFGLLPLLSAPGVWRAVTYLLACTGLASFLYAWRGRVASRWGAVSAVLAVLSIGLCTTQGPTAFWRHSPIGARRMLVAVHDPNDVERALRETRHDVIWERDGVESTVALRRANGYALITSGKSDGSCIGDAPTQIMSGLIGAILHPDLKRVLVIGLGTGSTAGWLAQVPSVERVDVLELEPAVLHVAEVCSRVNRDVLANPKVHILVGDGRDFLLTTRDTYDLVFSEPSNPYRAGVASLFTQEFYRAVAARLNPEGVFVQWVQGYEIQARSLHSIYTTLGTALPAVETWQVALGGDLLLVATRRPRTHDLAVLQARVDQEPYRSALALAWGVSGVEGLYAGLVGTTGLAEEMRYDADAHINTDNHTPLEYEFARSVGSDIPLLIGPLRERAVARGYQHAAVINGTVNWRTAEELRGARAVAEEVGADVHVEDDASYQRAMARQAYGAGKLAEARQHWGAQPEEPKTPVDTTMVAEVLADVADPRALPYIEAIRSFHPAEAEALLALWHDRSGQPQRAVAALVNASEAYRQVPWAGRLVMTRALALTRRLATQHPELAPALFDALAEPFAVRALDDGRLLARAAIGLTPGLEPRCAAALTELEPNAPWERDFLEQRVQCYSRVHHPLEARARADLDTFIRQTPKAQ
jgi:spermidine synthase